MSFNNISNMKRGNNMKNLTLPAVGIAALAALVIGLGSYDIINPGYRGIKVTLGNVDTTQYAEGLHFKTPFITSFVHVPIKQVTEETTASCFSSDLQTVNASLKVMYRIPEQSIVSIYREYSGNPFDTLISPRVQEAIKEVTATESAETIVKNREVIKMKALELARKKIGTIIVLEDLVIENLDLSAELEKAIEQKMVQEQEAAKAKFTQQQAEIEAHTKVIQSKAQAEINVIQSEAQAKTIKNLSEAEAKAISVKGQAIRENTGIVELTIAEKWNGVSPLVVGSGKDTSILLPIGKDAK